MAEPREQVLVGFATAFEVSGPEDGELYWLIEESDDGHIEWPEVRRRFIADKDDSMRG